MTKPRIVHRVYRLMLHALPFAFRRQYGAEMEATFLEAHAEARRTGGLAVPRLWIRETTDLLRTGAALRRSPPLPTPALPVDRGTSWPAVLFVDLRMASRSLSRHRGFFALTVLTLALGVGATTAMYSALRTVVLDPLPFPTADRLVTFVRESGDVRIALEREQLDLLRGETSLIDGFEAFWSASATLTGTDDPVRVNLLRVTAGMPSLMEVTPQIGRSFTSQETAGEGARVVMLSHGFWRSHFAGNPNVLGSALHLDGEPWTIVGVMPRHAARPDGSLQRLDVWSPLGDAVATRVTLARLAPGVAIGDASARVDAIVRPDGMGPAAGVALPILRQEPLEDHLWILMIAVSLLLIASCVNVANLLLQRVSARATETAVRSALGAGRLRLLRQFAFESILLAAGGAVLGIGLAHLALEVLAVMRPDQLEALRGVRLDRHVLAFSVAVSAGAGLAFGLVPAVSGSRVQATAALGRAGRGTFPTAARLRWTLVTAEVALSFALLIGAALVVDSLRDISARDPGFRADDLVVLDVRLPGWRYPTSEAREGALEEITSAIRLLPGVASASLATSMPPDVTFGLVGIVEVEGRPPETEPTPFRSVEAQPNYFETLGIPILAGRELQPEDAVPGTRNVVLSESAARRIFGGEDAVGRRVRIGSEMHIVGIAGDVHAIGLADTPAEPVIYLPLGRYLAQMTIAVRAANTDPQLLLALRQTVRRVETDAIVDIATVNERLHASIARERFSTSIISIFAVVSLLLAAIGIYGVLSQVVTARTREIGLRMALGASHARVAGLVVRWGSVATAAGLTVGGLLAWAGLRILRSEIFGLAEHQPGAYFAAAVVLVAVAAGAMLLPAFRAMRMSPLQAIGAE